MFTPLFTESKKDSIYEKMCNEGIKCTKEKLIFAMETSQKTFIFLEQGDKDSGLLHIIQGRKREFKSLNIEENEIPMTLIGALSSPKIVLTSIKWDPVTKKNETVKIYAQENMPGIRFVIADNGYIVTAWPISYQKVLEYKNEEDYRLYVKATQPRSSMCSGASESYGVKWS